MNFFDAPMKERKSGLLIPGTVDEKSANEKIAETYEKEAIDQAVKFMGTLPASEIASFLSTKAHSVEIIAES
jgi:hypothetical protein